jgi:hypothetical protein
MAAVAIAATVVQSYSAQASVVCRLLSHFAHFYLEFFYPRDSERECDRTIGSFSHQSEITWRSPESS